jgi:imidazolonepropionase-like amidohydrolase
VIDLASHTVTPGFIGCHVHLSMDASQLSTQLLDSAATKALVGRRLANDYLDRGFTTLRDLGSADPQWPTIDLRNATGAGTVTGPRLVIAAGVDRLDRQPRRCRQPLPATMAPPS